MTDTIETRPPPTAPAAGMAWVPDAIYRMGSDVHYREEAPTQVVSVDGFWIDRHQVTNAEFARFVAQSGYVTLAERPRDPAGFPGVLAEEVVPGSLVFTPTAGPVDLRHANRWWTWTPGACWRHPEGPRSGLDGRERHPVVHVAYEDAEAYARWAGKDLPTEVEWECAARGGLDGAEYVWGDVQLPRGEYLANWWQGRFPFENTARDGYEGLAPVGAFPPNGFDLFDMAGNAWEWTCDAYALRHPGDADGYEAPQPRFGRPRNVIKGGSYLCADSYSKRYRPAARRPQMIDTGMSHIGFRCVIRPGPGTD